MALLAEQLVEEWLNRNGYFTIRGIKSGVDEIDLLAIKPTKKGIEARHVEVQVSFRPISYLSKLTKEQQTELGHKSPNSAGTRPIQIQKAGIKDWISKKFSSAKKIAMRNLVLPDAHWDFEFVHGVVKSPAELEFIASEGIKLIPFKDIVGELCREGSPFSGGSATDIAEIIRYCPPERPSSQEKALSTSDNEVMLAAGGINKRYKKMMKNLAK